MENKRIADVKVAKIMTRDVITVEPDLSIRELKELFEKHDFNAFPVVENDRPVGIVTKLDLLRAFSMGRKFTRGAYFKLLSENVGDIMRRAIISVRPDDWIRTAIEYMVEFRLRSLPVLYDGRLVGILSRKDVIRCLDIEASSEEERNM